MVIDKMQYLPLKSIKIFYLNFGKKGRIQIRKNVQNWSWDGKNSDYGLKPLSLSSFKGL